MTQNAENSEKFVKVLKYCLTIDELDYGFDLNIYNTNTRDVEKLNCHYHYDLVEHLRNWLNTHGEQSDQLDRVIEEMTCNGFSYVEETITVYSDHILVTQEMSTFELLKNAHIITILAYRRMGRNIKDMSESLGCTYANIRQVISRYKDSKYDNGAVASKLFLCFAQPDALKPSDMDSHYFITVVDKVNNKTTVLSTNEDEITFHSFISAMYENAPLTAFKIEMKAPVMLDAKNIHVDWIDISNKQIKDVGSCEVHIKNVVGIPPEFLSSLGISQDDLDEMNS